MLAKLVNLLERLVDAHERHAAATERIAAVAEYRELSQPEPEADAVNQAAPMTETEPAATTLDMQETDHSGVHALLEETKWNPFETPVGEVRYQAKMTKLLRQLLDDREVGYPAKTKGADLHLMVLDAYPEFAVKSTDNSEATPPEEPANYTDFGEFKAKLVEYVGDDTERRKKLNDLINFFGAEKASDIPAERRFEFLAKLGEN